MRLYRVRIIRRFFGILFYVGKNFGISVLSRNANENNTLATLWNAIFPCLQDLSINNAIPFVDVAKIGFDNLLGIA